MYRLWGLISNYGPTMVYLIFKSINLYISIGVLNLKDEIDKSTPDKFVSNVKDLLDEISSNYSIMLYKGKHHEDYVRHIFMYLSSGKNSTFNSFVERCKNNWYTGT